jgi:hypothetical protein
MVRGAVRRAARLTASPSMRLIWLRASDRMRSRGRPASGVMAVSWLVEMDSFLRRGGGGRTAVDARQMKRRCAGGGGAGGARAAA